MKCLKTCTKILYTVATLLFLGSLTEANTYGNELEIINYGEEYVPPKRPILSCVSGSDCAGNECSVMGMQRFSEPRCEAKGQVGAFCRMGAEPENKSLSLPYATLECQDVYTQFCPCADGLVCREATCQPRRRANRPIYRSGQMAQRPKGAERNYQWTIYNGLYGDRLRT